MNTLDEIALKYGTDKSSKVNNYTGIYEEHFLGIRDKKIKLLEIGIGKGGSLRMWKEYFPNAEIYGLDIVECWSSMREDRLTPLRGDQGDTNLVKKLNEMYGPFDAVIDDGSHRSRDMGASFETLFPLLKKGGLYIVEGLSYCYKPEFTDWRKGGNFMKRIKELVDTINSGDKVEYIHLYKDIVFIKRSDLLEKK